MRKPLGEYIGTARRGDVLVFRDIDLGPNPVEELERFSEAQRLRERGIGVVLMQAPGAEVEIRRPEGRA